MIKLFSVKASTSGEWYSPASFHLEYFVIAENIMDALVKADAVVEELKVLLLAGGHPRASEFRIASLTEGSPITDGVAGPDREAWIVEVLAKVEGRS